MQRLKEQDQIPYELEPIPGVKVSKTIGFVGSKTLTPGDFDQLNEDKSTKAWRTWVYFKSKKKIPELSTNNYGNKYLVELIEKAAIATSAGHRNLADDYFVKAMEQTTEQFCNPRDDSAEALDRLGLILMKSGQSPKAITCFEYSLHMRKLIYGKDAVHIKIIQSLFYLGTAWAEYDNNHRAIIVFEKALENAQSLPKCDSDRQWTVQIAEIYHNMGSCWERLHEHRAALDCYGKATRLRRLASTPDVSLRRMMAQKNHKNVYKTA